MRRISNNYWCSDNDYGDQFLNFPMHPTLQPYCEVDLVATFPSRVNKDGEYFAKRRSNAMGVWYSPYNSVRGATLIKCFALQKKSDPTNLFDSDHIFTNTHSSWTP